MSERILYPCAKCGQCFTTKKNKDNHENKRICDDKNYTCDHCNRKFSTKGALDTHLKGRCPVIKGLMVVNT